MAVKNKKSTDKTAKEYEQMGRQLVSLYDGVNPNKGALYKASFIKGVLGGVGGVIGATLVITLLVWLLSLLDNVPLVGDFFEAISRSIDSSSK